MSSVNVDQVLSEMRRLAMAAQSGAEPVNQLQGSGEDFASLLKQSINTVNETQQTAGSMSTAFSAGDPNVDLGDVMIALQKASVSFQAMTEVRNRLVSAYQEIMSMQV